MRFLLDENVELRVAAFLKQAGHDVTIIAGDYSASLPDHEVLQRACTEGRILVTNDHDFGELIINQHLPHSGVVYFRLPLDTTAAEKITWLAQLLTNHQAALGRFVVITPSGIRVS